MHEIVILIMCLVKNEPCMCLIHEIELHVNVFKYWYHVSTSICEIGAIMCKKSG